MFFGATDIKIHSAVFLGRKFIWLQEVVNTVWKTGSKQILEPESKSTLIILNRIKFLLCLSLFPPFFTSLLIHFWPLCHPSLQIVCLSSHLSHTRSLPCLRLLRWSLTQPWSPLEYQWPMTYVAVSLFLCFMFALNSVRKQLFPFYLFLIKAVHYCIKSILIVCFSLSVLYDILFNYCRKLGQSMTIYNLVVLLITLGESKRRERENERAKVSQWLE